MGLLSFLGSKNGPSKHLSAACAEAALRPLDASLARRVVVASQSARLIFDVRVQLIEYYLSTAEAQGLRAYRESATQVLAMALGGLSSASPDMVAGAAIAFFDKAYLVSIGPLWNTLCLDVTVDGAHLEFQRIAILLPYVTQDGRGAEFPAGSTALQAPALVVAASKAPLAAAEPPKKVGRPIGSQPRCKDDAHEWDEPLYCQKHASIRMRIFLKDAVKPCGRRCLRCGHAQALPTEAVGIDPDPRCDPDILAGMMTADEWEGRSPIR